MSDKGGNPKQTHQGEHKKQEQCKNGNRQQQQFQRRTEYRKKDPEEIPVLRYGPNNNFTKFKEAMSKAALKNYGNLGRLIQLEGCYYQPTRPDRNDYNLSNDPTGLNQTEYLEDIKEYRKEVKAMEKDRPKLYALILQYLSDESLEEVKRSDDWDTIEQETDPAMLWDVIESTHKINTISKVESVTKMAARTTYQQMKQGAYERIITYKERFNNALKAYTDEGNPGMNDADVAMDFFRGLDNARYAGFKT
jgi:hypothetical protein